MKKVLYAAVFAACAAPAFAGDVGLTISVGQPGFYGQLDIGNVPRPPQLVYPQAVVVRQAPEFVAAPPIYLHVPPGHARNWRKYCHQYHACNRRVLFVKSAEYEPGYRPDRDHGHDDHYDRHDDRDHHGHDRGDHDHRDRDHGDHDHGDHHDHD